MASSLLLDANLAVLFVVGTTNRNYIIRHKRLNRVYDPIDFDLVCREIARYSGVIFTPNVLSETSNLIRYVADPLRSEISLVFAEMIRRADEQFVESRLAVNRSEYVRLGLTDSVLLTLAANGATLLTVDLGLYLAAVQANLHTVNYNHVRDALRADFR